MGLTQVSTSGIKDATVATADIADQAVTLAKLPHGTSSNNGKFLRANNGADPTFEDVPAGGISDVVSDTSPQLGGGLASNGFNINFADSNGSNNQAKFGDSGDLAIYHDNAHSRIVDTGTGDLSLQTSRLNIGNAGNTEAMAVFTENGSVDLYYDNSKKLETTSQGIEVSGEIRVPDNKNIMLGTHDDMQIIHTPNNGYIKNTTGGLYIQGGTQNNSIYIRPREGEDSIKANSNGSVQLYYDNSEKFNTANEGCVVTGGGLAVARGGSQYSGAIYFAGFGDTNHMLWQDHFDNPNGSRGTTNGWDGIKWNCYKGLRLYKGNEGENIAAFYSDGGCVLYYDNSRKFQTTSSGISVENTTSPISNTAASSAANDLVVSGDGDTGITIYTTGTSSKSNIFFADADDADVGRITYLHNNNQFRMYLNANGTPVMQWNSDLTIYFNGNMYSNGNSYSTGSDLRLKSNLVRFTNTLDKLKQIVGYQFDIKCGENRDKTRKSAGVIAQDVEKVYPELVEEVEGYKHLEYSAFTGILVEAVKELTTKIETLETKVAALEAA